VESEISKESTDATFVPKAPNKLPLEVGEVANFSTDRAKAWVRCPLTGDPFKRRIQILQRGYVPRQVSKATQIFDWDGGFGHFYFSHGCGIQSYFQPTLNA
jgi:hypothetical protein